MDFNFRSSYYAILIIGLSAVSILTMASFLNNVFADNVTMGSNMSINTNVNASSIMNGNINMTNNENMTGGTTGGTTGETPKILSPLQQFKSGVAANSVQCNTGFTLIIKSEDGSPACVHSQSVQILTARGWGTTP